MHSVHFVAALAGGMLLSGCASSWVASGIDSDNTNITMAGTPQVIRKTEEFNRVDLRAVITTYAPSPSGKAETVDAALADFRKKGNGDAGARNSIQRYVMMVADRRCEVYKQSVSELDSTFSMGFGALSTVTGVLGGLFVEASQALSATAGISSGLNAEFNKAFFKNTAVPVIFAGIDKKRADIAAEIQKNSSEADLSKYSLEQALSDAIRYNGACSTTEGMKYVQEYMTNPVDIDDITSKRLLSSYRQQCILRAQGSTAKKKDGTVDFTTAYSNCQKEAEALSQALGVTLTETPKPNGGAAPAVPAAAPAPAKTGGAGGKPVTPPSGN